MPAVLASAVASLPVFAGTGSAAALLVAERGRRLGALRAALASALVLRFGALGGFMTGSSSGANAMFAAPQAEAIAAIGGDALAAIAVHNVAAGLFMMAAPARVEFAVQLCPDRSTARPVQRAVLLVDLSILALLAVALLLVPR
ncbi:L-lactate permease [Leucobacter weissii]|uniref:L-lactate permease n=1 Tax=Leucobacter weissii TaxID=1983706 RepID=A0A939SAA0_9MICO|nr:L-lactate permease [Leucobacter weissii]MBO1901722.1 L-lactate permease [Leucobacter weissii]